MPKLLEEVNLSAGPALFQSLRVTRSMPSVNLQELSRRVLQSKTLESQNRRLEMISTPRTYSPRSEDDTPRSPRSQQSESSGVTGPIFPASAGPVEFPQAQQKQSDEKSNTSPAKAPASHLDEESVKHLDKNWDSDSSVCLHIHVIAPHCTVRVCYRY